MAKAELIPIKTRAHVYTVIYDGGEFAILRIAEDGGRLSAIVKFRHQVRGRAISTRTSNRGGVAVIVWVACLSWAGVGLFAGLVLGAPGLIRLSGTIGVFVLVAWILRRIRRR